MTKLILLKLGGSLITDKTQPYTARLDRLADLSQQIAGAFADNPDLQLILGHGSGSFGHTAAKQYRTREGITHASPPAPFQDGEAIFWRGFTEVHYQAAQLNRIVMEELHKADIPAMAFPPSASVTARDGQVLTWDVSPIRSGLENGILPVIYGDVVFDMVSGGTILSTEDLFQHLARQFTPKRILLAGLEAGVWEDFPGRKRLINQIDSKSYEAIRSELGTVVGADVTGGMESKVNQMLSLARELGLKVMIFSGEQPGNLKQALEGGHIGTIITA